MIGENRLISELREMLLKDECKGLSHTETIYKIINRINDMAKDEGGVK